MEVSGQVDTSAVLFSSNSAQYSLQKIGFLSKCHKRPAWLSCVTFVLNVP